MEKVYKLLKFQIGYSVPWKNKTYRQEIFDVLDIGECECGEQIITFDNIVWFHSKYFYLVENNMTDSLQKPYKEEDNFEALNKLKPTLYALFNECAFKIISKNHDYAGYGDFYRNFRKSENVDIPAWKGIFVRFQDKVSRIEGFIKTGILKVKDESIRDTVIDTANYILLMYACYLDGLKDVSYL